MITRIHVNQHVIRHNRTHGLNDPVITVKTWKSNQYAYEVKIHGPSRVVYTPECPLSCGATVYVETEAEVEIVR